MYHQDHMIQADLFHPCVQGFSKAEPLTCPAERRVLVWGWEVPLFMECSSLRALRIVPDNQGPKTGEVTVSEACLAAHGATVARMRFVQDHFAEVWILSFPCRNRTCPRDEA